MSKRRKKNAVKPKTKHARTKKIAVKQETKHGITENKVYLKSLFEKDPELIVSKDKCGNSFFHNAAAQQNRVEPLSFLCSQLSAGQSWIINEQNNKGSTPLHYVADKFDVEAMKTLLFYGAKINIANFEGSYPLDELFQYDKKPKNKTEEIQYKIHIIMDLLNWDYSMFIKYNTKGQKYHFDSNVIESYKDEYKSNEVFIFFQKIYNFFESNINIFPALPSNQQDHSLIILRIIKNTDSNLLEEFLNEFPEFKFYLNDVLSDVVVFNIKEDKPLVDILINHGADPFVADKHGRSAFSDAIYEQNIPLAKKFLNNDQRDDIQFCKDILSELESAFFGMKNLVYLVDQNSEDNLQNIKDDLLTGCLKYLEDHVE